MNVRGGFVRIDLMILVAVAIIDFTLVLPRILRLIDHQPISTGNWIWFGIGAALLLLAGGTTIKLIAEWNEWRRKD